MSRAPRRSRIDRDEHVEVDESVVERRDQRVGHRMGQPHQISVVAGRIDDDEIVRVLDGIDRGGELVELGCLIVGHQRTVLRAMQ